ncbi:hypothetical protein HZC31_00760, partial [Candidatus Woesearchaeota archaeon]|nr:hypothetical protein [Candidatus Woesearchaeota archaeon]
MIWNNNLTHGDMLIAGFVTPHAPEVKELLREAAEYAPGNTLSNLCNWCETSNDWRLTMQAEIKAIYSALKYRYDITYVNTPIAYGDAETAVYQTVYLPSESLIYKSANCMDGTVLFASALEAIGIDAYIFLVPGHALVDVLELPITGKEEDAVDQLSTLLLIYGGWDQAALRGAVWFYLS